MTRVVRIPAGGIDGTKLREAAAAEFGAVTELVAAALRRHYGMAANDFGCWPHSIYADRVIVRREGKLFEFPYTLSEANEVTLGAATEITFEPRPVTGAMREAAATDLGQITELVRCAVRKKIAQVGGYGEERYVCIEAIHVDRVIVRADGGRLTAYPYTIGEDNVVTVGDGYEVVMQAVAVSGAPAAPTLPSPAMAGGDGFVEANATACFLEAKPTEAGKPDRYLVRVIRAGVSLNNTDYPSGVLREAVPLFDGARVFVKSDAEHLKGGGKDVRQLAGRLSSPTFVEATNDAPAEIRADMLILQSSPVSAQLREAVANGMTDLFGLSIDATGASKPKGKFREATRITRVDSVDLIIEPGAGGQVIRFIEAKGQEPDMLRQQMLDTIRRRDANRAAALETADDAAVLAAFREAVAAETADTAVPNAPAALTQADLDAHARLVEARGNARLAVLATRLPQPAKDRLCSRFAESKDIAELATDKVEAAIKAEQDYGKAFRESAPVSGLGREHAQAGDPDKRTPAMQQLDDFFSGKWNGSFREAYVSITGDRNITGHLGDCDASRLREAAGDHFLEAVSASTFANILGNSITRRMQEIYRDNPAYSDWRDLVDVVPVRDFRTQERTRIGGYGNLPAVAENGNYTALTTPSDEKATYAVSKRGGTETISIETIANDDVGVIRRIPQSLARAAGRTLYEFVLGFLDTNPAIFDSVALFHASHANLATAALDATSFAAMRLAMKKQTELTSAKRLGLILRHLYVPGELEEAAFNLFVRGTNNDETFVQTAKPRVHVVPHWTDANNWYGTADKAEIPLIELGFFNGNEEPELFIQDNPSQGSLFSNDQIKYKIRHIYGGNVLDYRGFQGALVP